MTTESDALVGHIAAQRRIISADLDRLEANVRASLRGATSPRRIILRHPLATAVFLLTLAFAMALLISRRSGR